MSNTMDSSVRYRHVMASITYCNGGNVIHTCSHQQLAAVWIPPEKVPTFIAPQSYIVIIVSDWMDKIHVNVSLGSFRW